MLHRFWCPRDPTFEVLLGKLVRRVQLVKAFKGHANDCQLTNRVDRKPGLPWIWISMDISMDISMCGYQTRAILWIYPWIFDIGI